MKKSNLWQKLILFLMVLGMLAVWPVCILRTEEKQTMEHDVYEVTGEMPQGSVFTQYFRAEESVLNAFELVIDYDPALPAEGIFQIAILNEKNEVIYDGLFPYYLVKDYTFFRLETYNLRLKKGDIYHYRLTNQDITENLPHIAYTRKSRPDGEGYQRMLLNDTEIEGEAFVRFEWKRPYDFLSILMMWSCLGLGGFFLWEILEQWKNRTNRMKKGEKNV